MARVVLGAMTDYSLERLEWPAVLERIARRAETEGGRAAVLARRPRADQAWLDGEQAAFREASDPRSPVRGLSVAGAVDPVPWVTRAAKGAVLTPEELWRLAVTVERGARLKAAVDPERTPTLWGRYGALDPPHEVRRAIEAAVTDLGEVRDDASPRLYEIRQRIRAVEEEIDRIFQDILRSPAWRQVLMEPLVTIRAGRRVVPVRQELRHQLPGLVHDQSGSGQTVFVEPMAVVERQNRLAALRAEERHEIERILRQLSEAVGKNRLRFEALGAALAEVDALLAAVRWAEAVDATLPRLGGPVLRLEEARHPLLEAPVPISLECGGARQALVITGPNTGGKTVALKCTGLVVALALAGWPVPAKAGTTVPLFADVLVDIGDEQSLEQSLSTFSGHLRQIVPMVQRAGPDTLLLVDEIGAGTDPEEGAALAVALLEAFLARGATAVVTTHFLRVKLMAYGDPRVVNAQVEFDRATLRPTYRLVMGQPGASHALYIAERLGLDPGVVARARALMGQDHVALEEVITRLNETERRLEAERREAEAIRRRLQAAERELFAERSRWERRREQVLEAERARWRRAVADLTARAEAVIEAARTAEREERERALTRLREEMRSWGLAPPVADEPAPKPPGARPVAVGDWAVGGRITEPARVVAITGDEAVVEAGAVRLRVPRGELVPAAPPRTVRPAARPVRVAAAARPEVDLRGLSAADALDALDRYLDQAVLGGLGEVRVIHGKGTGVLRRAVAEFLTSDGRVAGFRLGAVGEGGDGVTVVRLRESG